MQRYISPPRDRSPLTPRSCACNEAYASLMQLERKKKKEGKMVGTVARGNVNARARAAATRRIIAYNDTAFPLSRRNKRLSFPRARLEKADALIVRRESQRASRDTMFARVTFIYRVSWHTRRACRVTFRVTYTDYNSSRLNLRRCSLFIVDRDSIASISRVQNLFAYILYERIVTFETPVANAVTYRLHIFRDICKMNSKGVKRVYPR